MCNFTLKVYIVRNLTLKVYIVCNFTLKMYIVYMGCNEGLFHFVQFQVSVVFHLMM